MINWCKNDSGFQKHKGRSINLFTALSIVFLLALGSVSAWYYLNPKPQLTKIPAPTAVSLDKPKSPFSSIRKVDVMGMQVVVLRHKPTAQRVAVLSNATASPDQYQLFYNQPLSTWELDMLLALFKPQSKFENKKVHVNDVKLVKTGVLKDKSSKLVYKQYKVDTQVDGERADYDAYLGMQVAEDKPQMLVFTFNSTGHVYQEALQDFLTVSQPRRS